MNHKWDYDVPTVEFWKQVLRVLKPGGYLLSFAGARTYHRMAINIEDAGFEIRDQIMWVYGEGFPKSHDIGKAMDKHFGAERQVIGVREDFASRAPKNNFNQFSSINPTDNGINTEKFAKNMGVITAPATHEAEQWSGWGTALKPAHEPICMARKPLSEPTIVLNVLKYGVGGINIDGTRIETDEVIPINRLEDWSGFGQLQRPDYEQEINTKGRWAANFIHDGSDAVLETFPSADKARFFYCAKATKKERDAGLDDLEETNCGMMEDDNYPIKTGNGNLRNTKRKNFHPTVKPLALMRYLCRLITPPNGFVLDPFAGSGSTACACILEDFNYVGIEVDSAYHGIAVKKTKHYETETEK